MAAAEFSAGAQKGVKVGDSKRLLDMDCIVAWSLWKAKEMGTKNISRASVAKFLKRSERWVQQHWHENPYKIEEDDQEQRALSQESKAVIREMLARPKKKSVR